MSTLQTLIGIVGGLILAVIVVLLLRRQGPLFDLKDEFEEPKEPRGPSAREIEYDRRATELDEKLGRGEISEAEHADLRATLATRFERNERLD